MAHFLQSSPSSGNVAEGQNEIYHLIYQQNRKIERMAEKSNLYIIICIVSCIGLISIYFHVDSISNQSQSIVELHETVKNLEARCRANSVLIKKLENQIKTVTSEQLNIKDMVKSINRTMYSVSEKVNNLNDKSVNIIDMETKRTSMMDPEWPDIIHCHRNDGYELYYYLVYDGRKTANKAVHYRHIWYAHLVYLTFDANGGYKSHNCDGDCDCNGKSIHELIDKGKTFNFGVQKTEKR